MYPVLRLATELARHRNVPPLAFGETHVTTLTCLPNDIDPWMEMNNGRVMTLFDLARVVLFRRSGMIPVMRTRRWAGAIAGSHIRYRRRVHLWKKVEVRARFLGYDERFSYAEQSMWRLSDGECSAHALLRMAVSSRDGLVPAPEVAAALGVAESPPLPDWAEAWIAAEAQRPWPPERG